jgi:hypothetical protein
MKIKIPRVPWKPRGPPGVHRYRTQEYSGIGHKEYSGVGHKNIQMQGSGVSL